MAVGVVLFQESSCCTCRSGARRGTPFEFDFKFPAFSGQSTLVFAPSAPKLAQSKASALLPFPSTADSWVAAKKCNLTFLLGCVASAG